MNPGDSIQNIHGDYSKSMTVYSTNENEIVNIVHDLKCKSSKGHDNISPHIVKNVIFEIAKPLSLVFNNSLLNGQFPDKMKIARVVPIYKSDDKSLIGNYRPIAILPFFQKF